MIDALNINNHFDGVLVNLVGFHILRQLLLQLLQLCAQLIGLLVALGHAQQLDDIADVSNLRESLGLRHAEETAVGELCHVVVEDASIHRGHIEFAVVVAHAPDVFVGGALHQFRESSQFLKLTSGIVQFPHLLWIVQRVVHVTQVVAGFSTRTRQLLQYANKCLCLATEGMVEVVGIKFAIELIDRTDERTHGAGFATLHIAQARVVDAVVGSSHFFPVPAILVGTFITLSRTALVDDKASRTGGCGIDVASV